MRGQIRMWWWLTPWLLIQATVGVALGWGADQDGELVESRVVELNEEDVGQLAEMESNIREILARVEIRSITYWSDGLKVKGYMVVPREGDHLPCVVYNRGGNREFGVLDDFRAGLFLARMASWGYVVVASNYRGNGGGEGHEEFGGKDVHDVLNLIPLLKRESRADVNRLGMVGWSRGGLMACLALAQSDQFRGVVLGASMFDAHRCVADRSEMETEVFAELIPGYAENKKAALDSRSPVMWAERLNKKTPLLILQGGADSKVNPRESLDMAERLLDCHHPFRLVMFEGAEHGIREHREEVDRLTKGWLDRYVRDLVGVE